MSVDTIEDGAIRELDATELEAVSGGLDAGTGAMGFTGLAIGLAALAGTAAAMPVALGFAAGAAVVAGGIAVYEAI